jgi:hypothetical protein
MTEPLPVAIETVVGHINALYGATPPDTKRVADAWLKDFLYSGEWRHFWIGVTVDVVFRRLRNCTDAHYALNH